MVFLYLFKGFGSLRVRIFASIEDSIRCIKCQHSYKGLIEDKYISSCSPIEGCSEEFVPGLPTALNIIVSCHKCSDNKYPILFADAGGQDFSGFQRYSKYTTDLYKSDVTVNPSYSIDCLLKNDPFLKVVDINVP